MNLFSAAGLKRKLCQYSPSKFQTTVEMKLYEYTLHQWYMLTVAEVNRKLVEMDAQPLTNLVDGFDENGRMVAN